VPRKALRETPARTGTSSAVSSSMRCSSCQLCSPVLA
jgi:hypothetical protein